MTKREIDRTSVLGSAVILLVSLALGIIEEGGLFRLDFSMGNGLIVLFFAFLTLALIRLLVLAVQCLVHVSKHQRGAPRLLWILSIVFLGIASYVYFLVYPEVGLFEAPGRDDEV